MKSNEIPQKVFAHRNEDDGGWSFTLRRKEPDDLRFPNVSEQDAAYLLGLATSSIRLDKEARRLLRRLAGVGGR